MKERKWIDIIEMVALLPHYLILLSNEGPVVQHFNQKLFFFFGHTIV